MSAENSELLDTREFIDKYQWMVRPCALYKDEYSDCTSIRARLHQHFVYGEFVDCAQWNQDYNNCTKWEDNKSVDAFKSVIKNEMERRRERLNGSYGNNVWSPRSEPPPDWNSPLPEALQKRQQSSYLSAAVELEKSGLSPPTSFCSIM